MVRITFHHDTGRVQDIDATAGVSLMDNARAAGVDGIEGECGGSMICGTCHVHLDEAWFAALPAAGAIEAEMVEYTLDPRPTSRLSCQITVTDAMEGMIVGLPRAQR
jgi:ferredoxin, 2Fe-2S